MTPDNKTFCLLPWNQIFIWSDGTIRPCNFNARTIYKPNGDPYKFGIDTLDDIINSEELKDVRRKMLNGEEVAGCERCYMHEKNGAASYRTFWKTIFPPIENPTEIQRIEDIVYIDIKFGNLCNLKCRMCSPALSSEVDKEIKELKFTDNKKVIDLGIVTIEEDINAWYETDEFNDSIAKLAPYLIHIYITGGEPTVIKKYYWLLQYLIDKGYSKNITIRTNSNLTNVSGNMLNMMMEFKEIIYGTSMDGVGKINDYIRAPSNWSQLDKNLRRVLSTDLPKKYVLNTIAMTPLNLETLPELFSYMHSLNTEYGKPVIHLMPAVVDHAHYYNIGNLPKEFKMECWSKIEEWMKSEELVFDKRFHEGMQRLKGRCMEDTFNYDSLVALNDHTNLLDKHRDQKLEVIAPKLCKVLVDLGIRKPLTDMINS